MNRSSLFLHALDLAVLIAAASFFRVANGNEKGEPAVHNGVLYEVAIGDSLSGLRVPLEIGYAQYTAGLASAELTTLSSKFEPGLARLPPELDPEDDELEPLRIRRAPPLSLGDVSLTCQYGVVGCADFERSYPRWASSAAIIGIDSLSKIVLQLDFKQNKLRVLTDAPDDPGVGIPIVSLRDRPPRACATVMAKVGGQGVEEEFYVLLESPETLHLKSSLSQTMINAGQLRGVHLESSPDAAAVSQLIVGKLDSFELGQSIKKKSRTLVDGDNAIGLGYLSQFVVTFDFPRATMYLKPAADASREQGVDVSGLSFEWRSEKLVVTAVAPDSAADRSGIAPGDIIEAVGEMQIRPANVSKLRTALRNEGKTLRLRLRRQNMRMDHELSLKASGSVSLYNDSSKASVVAPALPELQPRSAPLRLAPATPR